MHGLVVGRFQPVHRGHEALLRTAMERCPRLTIIVGSSEAPPSPKNPFDVDERTRMLRSVVGDGPSIIPFPDLHDPPRWAREVVAKAGDVEIVFGNDERTLDLFDRLGLQAVQPGLVEETRYSGRLVRNQLEAGDESWRKAVPKGVAEVLAAIDAGARLRRLTVQAA